MPNEDTDGESEEMAVDEKTYIEVDGLNGSGESTPEHKRDPDGILLRIWKGVLSIIFDPINRILKGDWVTSRKVWAVRRFWHGFVGWVITMFIGGMVVTYSTGRFDLIRSEYGTTADSIVQNWYIYSLQGVPLNVHGTPVDYDRAVAIEGQFPGYGPVSGGPIYPTSFPPNSLPEELMIYAAFIIAGMYTRRWLAGRHCTLRKSLAQIVPFAVVATMCSLIYALTFASVSTPAGRIGPSLYHVIITIGGLAIALGGLGNVIDHIRWQRVSESTTDG
jgi:uncharacterized membrane protein